MVDELPPGEKSEEQAAESENSYRTIQGCSARTSHKHGDAGPPCARAEGAVGAVDDDGLPSPYGLRADSIYVTGSPHFRRAVIGGLLKLARAQPQFGVAYNVVAASPHLHIRIGEDPTNSVCAKRGMMAVNCQAMANRRIANIVLGSNPDATSLARGAGHEMIHAFGDFAKNHEAVQFDPACGDPDSSPNGCVQYYWRNTS